jgi:hypothetical protein
MIIVKRPGRLKKGWFAQDLDAYLKTKSSAVSNYKRKHTIRPSEISGCTRKIVRMLLNQIQQKPVEPKQQRIFDNGNSVHRRYLKSYLPAIGNVAIVEIEENGALVQKPFIEVSIEDPELWLKGAPDAVVINKRDDLPYIFELKSIKQESFEILEAPSEEYLDQVHLYMYMTKIPRAIVFYENKNNQDIIDFYIELDQARLDGLLEKAKSIKEYVLNYETTKALPPRCRSKYCEGCNDKDESIAG